MNYDRDKLKEAQKASLEILLAVDRICRDNGLKYLMDSGTLLGAVRHKGFIPWDDDVDIAMTRENFDRFRELAGTSLPANMRLLMPWDFDEGRAFYDFTPRIIYLNSKRHRDTAETDYYEGKLNHLWADIFILDAVPDGFFKDRLTRLRQKILYGYAMSKRQDIDYSKYGLIDKLKVFVLSLAGSGRDMRDIFKAQERLSRKYDGLPTENFYYSDYQPDFLHDTIKRKWSEETCELEFEGHMLMAPKAYDEVLKEIYGDYMKLPPEDERVPSHSDEIEVCHL